MRTVFVNPSRVRRRRRKSRRPSSSHRTSRKRYSRKRRRRSNPSLIQNPRRRRRRRRNAGITSFVSNPGRRYRRRRRNPLSLRSLPSVLRSTATVALGAAGGAGLNRVGLSHITNFWMRNGARVVSAAALVAFGGNSPMAAAAAGAVLAPIVPEVEMQLASTAKNPQELAMELAGLLGGGGLQESLDDDPNLAADLSDLTSW